MGELRDCGAQVAGQVAVGPEGCAAGVEVGGEVEHACYGVEEEAQEVREGGGGDAVGWMGVTYRFFGFGVEGVCAYLSRCSGGPFLLCSYYSSAGPLKSSNSRR